MLHEFIAEHRDEIIRRCRAKVASRSIPPPSEAEIDHGVPVFLDQLMESIGIVLNTIAANMRTEGLLKQSQLLTSELQAQQGELKKTNDRLEQQAASLRLLASDWRVAGILNARSGAWLSVTQSINRDTAGTGGELAAVLRVVPDIRGRNGTRPPPGNAW